MGKVSKKEGYKRFAKPRKTPARRSMKKKKVEKSKQSGLAKPRGRPAKKSLKKKVKEVLIQIKLTKNK